MEKLKITLVLLLMAVASYGQSAKEVLDKAAKAVSNKSGVTASFTLKGGQMNDKGTISIKGRKLTCPILTSRSCRTSTLTTSSICIRKVIPIR